MTSQTAYDDTTAPVVTIDERPDGIKSAIEFNSTHMGQLWALLLSLGKEPVPPGTRVPDYTKRATNFLRYSVGSRYRDIEKLIPKTLGRLISSAGLPEGEDLGSALRDATAEIEAQRERLVENLPGVAWEAAGYWLERSSDAAFEAARTANGAAQVQGFVYFSTIFNVLLDKSLPMVKHQREAHSIMAGFATLEKGIWSKAVASAGGALHFLQVMLAIAICHAVDGVFRGISGAEAEVLTSTSSRQALEMLMGEDRFWQSIWTDASEKQARLLCTLSPEQASTYVKHLSGTADRFNKITKAALATAKNGEQAAKISDDEARHLRHRADKDAAHLRDTQRQLELSRQECVKLRSGRESAPPAENADAARELESLRDELREMRKELGAMADRCANQDQELSELREFANLLLTPPADARPESAPVTTAQTNLRKVRAVIVGGHERTHAKLRKELPNAIFLHPDRELSVDAFAKADCALFCVGYCSHKLYWAAANEIRRQGIPAAYAHHVNIDKMLDSIRSLVGASE